MKTPTTKKIKSMAAGLSLITFALLDGTAQAGTDTWTGATSANWGDSNWTGANNPPASGDSLIFTSATGVGGTALNNNLTSSGFNVAGLIYNSGAAAFTVSGNAFALTGPITNNSTSLQTINDPFSLSSPLIFSTTAGGGNLLLGGSISGAGGITNAGSGTLTLSGVNTYTGATTVFAGKLLLGNASALPATTTLTVTTAASLT